MHSIKDKLLSKYGKHKITVTTANTHSKPKGTALLQTHTSCSETALIYSKDDIK